MEGIIIKIKNMQLEGLVSLLGSLSLKGKESRMRTLFLDSVVDHFNNYILPSIKQLKEDYVIKDEEGNIIYENEEKTKVQFKIEYLDAEQDLLNEFFIFEINESNQKMLTVVSEILLDGEFLVDGEIAKFYDEWCDQAEIVLEKYNKIRKDA